MHEDEWHVELYKTAKEELSKREISYSDEDIENHQKVHIQELEKGKKNKRRVELFLLYFAVGGSILGVISGLAIAFTKTKGFDGNKYYYYNQRSRGQGIIIAIVGAISMLIQLFVFFQLI